MIRGNLGAAMQGLAVVPLFAGFDTDARPTPPRAGPHLLLRRHRRPVRGARLLRRRLRLDVRPVRAEEAVRSAAPTGRRGPGRRRGALRRRRRRHRHRRSRPDPPDLPGGGHRDRRRRGALDRRARSAWSSRGRRRRPACSTRAADRAARPAPTTRPPDSSRTHRRDDADLRLTRAVHARPLGICPQGHRPRPQRGGHDVRPAACCSSPRTIRRPCTRSARSTTGSASPRSAGTTSSRTCAPPASGWPTCGASPTTGGTSPAAGWRTPTRRPSGRSSPSTRSRSRSSCASPRSAAPAPVGSAPRSAPTSCTGSPTTARSSTRRRFVVMGGATEPVITALTASFTAGWDLPTALAAAVKALGTAGEGAPRELLPAQLEVAVLDRTLAGRTFRRIEGRAGLAGRAGARRRAGGSGGGGGRMPRIQNPQIPPMAQPNGDAGRRCISPGAVVFPSGVVEAGRWFRPERAARFGIRSARATRAREACGDARS